MATNEQEVPVEVPPTKEQRALAAVGMAATKVADVGPHSGISFRVWAMFIVLAAILAVGTFPLNVVGTVVLTALAITLASRARTQR